MSRFWIVILVACSSSTPHELPDAAPPDAPIVVPPDAAPDAMVDAPPPDATCPNRTVGPGILAHPYAASEIYPTSITVKTPADLTALRGIKVISGDLNIGGTIAVVDLPDLEVVTGSVFAFGDALDELHFARLETTGGAFQAYRTPDFADLAIVEAPRLEALAANLYLQISAAALPCLRSIMSATVVGPKGALFALPRLTTADWINFADLDATTVDVSAWQHGELQIQSGALTAIHAGSPTIFTVQNAAPNLATVTLASNADLLGFTVRGGALRDLDLLAGAPKLVAVEMTGASRLRSIAGLAGAPLVGLTISDAPDLVSLSAVRDTPFSDWLWIFNTGATTLAFPGTTALSNSVRIVGNRALTSLALPNLANVGSGDDRSFLSDNAMLPTCQATAIRAHVRLHAGSTFTIAGNLADGCSALRP